MKEYKVLKDYSDKYTHEYQPAGATVKLTDGRGKELTKLGLVKIVAQKKEKAE